MSGDLSCERFRHISATEAEIGAIEAAWDIFEPLARQVAAHNDTYDAACAKPASDPRGKSK